MNINARKTDITNGGIRLPYAVLVLIEFEDHRPDEFA